MPHQSETGLKNGQYTEPQIAWPLGNFERASRGSRMEQYHTKRRASSPPLVSCPGTSFAAGIVSYFVPGFFIDAVPNTQVTNVESNERAFCTA
jgi:hypothetical protein